MTDDQREARIQALRQQMQEMAERGRWEEAIAAEREMRAEIKRRSPQQVERMERAMGIRR